MKFFPLRTFIKRRPGVSLIIAMLMVMGFMLQMSSMMSMIKQSVQLQKNMLYGEQAYLNARSAIEFGLYTQTHSDKAKTLENITDAKYKVTLTDNGGSFGTEEDGGKWEVKNLSDNTPTWFTDKSTVSSAQAETDPNAKAVFPFPGTGTVGGTYCDLNKVPKSTQGVDEQFKKDMFFFEKGYEPDLLSTEWKGYSPPTSVDTLYEHPCFWNKLEDGKTANIPLFVYGEDCPEDGYGNHVCNPDAKGADLDAFILRIRTTCKPDALGKMQTICDPGQRWKLNSAGIDSLDKERVVLWDITGKCTTGTCYITQAGMDTLQGENLNLDKSFLTKKEISVIAGYFINNVNKAINLGWTGEPFTVLDFFQKDGTDFKGEEGKIPPPSDTISNFLRSEGKKWGKNGLSKPTLHLSVSANLQSAAFSDSDKVTLYGLEYQILYHFKNVEKVKGALISDPIVVAEGYNHGFGAKLKTSLSHSGGSFGYVLVEE